MPLEASVLVVAAELFARGIAEIHGYDLARHLAERTHARLLTSHGTLYRALSRLESMGLLDSRWEIDAIATIRRGRRGGSIA